MLSLESLLNDEALRRAEFPVVNPGIFLAHAGVTILPQRVVRTMQDYLQHCCDEMQEYPAAWRAVNETRVVAAKLIGAQASEISLLGPTSVGLSLVAAGLDWQAGDEVVCYAEDYPANVYPWRDLERQGVIVREVQPPSPGAITVEVVERTLTAKTRLVALASCHYLTGFRIDVDAIGKMLHERGILFCLDAIQTLGAFETRVDHVDFLSADSHKWLLGPMSAGIFYVKESLQEKLRPALLGSWNVQSPRFVAQPEIAFERGGRRYEPGALNIVGIIGMKAGIDLITEIGLPAISTQLLRLRRRLLDQVAEKVPGLVAVGAVAEADASGIVTFVRGPDSGLDMDALHAALTQQGIIASLRHNRADEPHLRFSPHFYNTEAEMDRVAAALAAAV